MLNDGNDCQNICAILMGDESYWYVMVHPLVVFCNCVRR